MANENAADGVTFNMLLPGRIQTERVDELDAANAERTPPAELRLQPAPETEADAQAAQAVNLGKGAGDDDIAGGACQ